jgi:hypothetical protein
VTGGRILSGDRRNLNGGGRGTSERALNRGVGHESRGGMTMNGEQGSLSNARSLRDDGSGDSRSLSGRNLNSGIGGTSKGTLIKIVGHRD